MTSAVAPATSPPRPQAVPIIILGTDALLAALPATPVQLAHACLRAGFSNAIPASWGDELIAAAVLRRLPQFAGGPAIQCSCPIVAHRLLSVGGDLRPAMLGFVAPPVAIARYVRALSGTTPVRITYVGGCPGANDDAIDIRMRPDALLALLAERDIAIEEQPRVFESILPPDRRRFRSQPGGVPTAESLWSDVGARTLIEVDGEDFVSELAQQLLTGKNVLIDAAPHLGCVCSGAIAGVAVKDARAGVVTLEPPRAMMPVVEEHAAIELELAVPAVARAPVDVSAAVAVMHTSPARGVTIPVAPGGPPARTGGHRFSPIRGLPVVTEARPHARSSGPISQRSVLGSAPVARDVEGKSLPRAYIARRRSSPRGMPAIAIPDHPLQAPPSRPTRPTTRPSEDVLPLPGPTAPALPATKPADPPPLQPVSPETVAPSVAEPVPAPVVRDPRSTPISPAADPVVESPRVRTRPRPSVVVERDSGANFSTRRLIILGIGALVLSAIVSVISGYIVARVVRSSMMPASTTAPISTKP
jgi:hypothetical protein